MEYYLIRVSPRKGTRTPLTTCDDFSEAVDHAIKLGEKDYDVLDEDTKLHWKVRAGVREFPL